MKGISYGIIKINEQTYFIHWDGIDKLGKVVKAFRNKVFLKGQKVTFRVSKYSAALKIIL